MRSLFQSKQSFLIYIQMMLVFLTEFFISQFYSSEECEPLPVGHWVIAEAPGKFSHLKTLQLKKGD